MGNTRWVWLTNGRGIRTLAFCYVDPTAGPSAKGGEVGEPPSADEIRAAIDHPSQTVRRPEHFGAVAIGAEDALRMGLPKEPPWIGFFENKPVPPPRGEPAQDVHALVIHDGVPVENALVQLGEVFGAAGELLVLDKRTTDREGRVTFPLAPTRSSVSAMARLGSSASKITAVAADGTVVLDLIAMASLEGRVTRAGAPICGHISITGTSGGPHRVVTGAGDGSYYIPQLVPDTYDVIVRSVHPETFMSAGTPTFARIDVQAGARAQHDFVLQAGVPVEVIVHTTNKDERVSVTLLVGHVTPQRSTDLHALFRELPRGHWLSANSMTIHDSRIRTELLDVVPGSYTLCVMPLIRSGRDVPQRVAVKHVVIGAEPVTLYALCPPLAKDTTPDALPSR